MHSRHHARPTLLCAPDGGLPGIPGSGPAGGSGLPGIPGSGSTPQPVSGQPQPTAAQASPVFSQPTPQQTGGPVTYELAGWWSRVGATLLDGLILLVPTIVLIAALGISVGSTSSSSTSSSADFSFAATGGIFAALGIYLLLTLLYAPLTMSKLDGATLGKRAVGIRVVRADGAPITFGYAALRELVFKGIVLGALNFVTFSLASLVNYLWPLWDSENRALHDMAAKSRVVRR